MTSKYALLLASTCLVAACGGKSVGSEPDPQPIPIPAPIDPTPPKTCGTPTSSGGVTTIECFDDGGAPGLSDANPGIPEPALPDPDASRDGEAPGTVCGVAPGTSVVFATAQSACDAFVGSWRICAGDENLGSFPSNVIGMEFGPGALEATAAGPTTGGVLYLLIDGTNGPERGIGAEYVIKYDVSDEGPQEYQLNIHPYCGGASCGLGGGFAYSAAPKLLSFGLDFGTGSVALVPF